MQLQSNSLKRNFDFVTFEKEENGRPIKIIMHDSLQDVIHNQAEGVHYAYDMVSTDVNHSVVLCTMWDDNGRKVQEVGESLPITLTNDIAQSYPSLIASQRAFDRAAIRYLNLPGKVFSNLEIALIDEIPESFISNESKTEASGIVSTVIENEEVGDVIHLEDASDITIPDEIIIDTGADEIVIEDKTEDDSLPFDVNDTEDSLDNYVITMNGRYQNSGYTLLQIYNENAGWLHWVAGPQFTARNAVATKDKEMTQKFLAADPARAEKYEAYLKGVK